MENVLPLLSAPVQEEGNENEVMSEESIRLLLESFGDGDQFFIPESSENYLCEPQPSPTSGVESGFTNSPQSSPVSSPQQFESSPEYSSPASSPQYFFSNPVTTPDFQPVPVSQQPSFLSITPLIQLSQPVFSSAHHYSNDMVGTQPAESFCFAPPNPAPTYPQQNLPVPPQVPTQVVTATKKRRRAKGMVNCFCLLFFFLKNNNNK